MVDNGSADATSSELRNYSRVEVISNPTKQGFAAVCNQDAAAARSAALVFLNNDTPVFNGWLEELVAPLADSEVVLLARARTASLDIRLFMAPLTPVRMELPSANLLWLVKGPRRADQRLCPNRRILPGGGLRNLHADRRVRG